MKKQNLKQNNYAFIDSQNLNLGIINSGWKLDFARFRVYLKDKYQVDKAFLFIGYVQGNNKLYTSLQNSGFICIFKPTLVYKDGTVKGNCDAELVLHTMIELGNFDKAVVVSGDGDFYCLVEHLIGLNKLQTILVPNQKKFSALLNFKICREYLQFMNNLEHKLSYKNNKKGPVRTKP